MRKWVSGVAAGCALAAVTAAGGVELVRFTFGTTWGFCRGPSCGDTDANAIASPPIRKIDRGSPSATPAALEPVSANASAWKPRAAVARASLPVESDLLPAIGADDLADPDTFPEGWSDALRSRGGDPLFMGVHFAPSGLVGGLGSIGGGSSAAGANSPGGNSSGGNSSGGNADDPFAPVIDAAKRQALESLTDTLALPEPGTWLLMIVGTGLTGAMLRRRRGEQAAHAGG